VLAQAAHPLERTDWRIGADWRIGVGYRLAHRPLYSNSFARPIPLCNNTLAIYLTKMQVPAIIPSSWTRTALCVAVTTHYSLRQGRAPMFIFFSFVRCCGCEGVVALTTATSAKSKRELGLGLGAKDI